MPRVPRLPVVCALVVVLAACASPPSGPPGSTTTRRPTSSAPRTVVTSRPTTAPPATTTPGSTAPPTTIPPPSPSVFRGLGAWVDLFDVSRRFIAPGATPAVGPADAARMADLGVRTLYLQAARDDPRAAGAIADPDAVGDLLVAAHAAGLRVVGWYLPTFTDAAADRRRMRALAAFERDGQRFDALLLDVESLVVTDPALRTARLLEVARGARNAAGSRPLGAAVLPAVPLEILRPEIWPGFPYRELAPMIDGWLPMSYWTYRTPGSEWRDPYRYTLENVRRLRADVGRGEPIHVVGGVGDRAALGDYAPFMRAVTETGVRGWSVYDYATTPDAAWPVLAG